MAPDVNANNAVVFFFSSRRRHTRLQGDWSSDVCSSDLARRLGRSLQAVSRLLADLEQELGVQLVARTTRSCRPTGAGERFYERIRTVLARSEERRVGEECRSRWAADH